MNPSNQKSGDKFTPFATGVFIGVLAALLFATDEGRKIVKDTLDAIPDKYKKMPEQILHPHEEIETPSVPLITPQETPHHATYDFTPFTAEAESPPPPAPTVSFNHPAK